MLKAPRSSRSSVDEKILDRQRDGHGWHVEPRPALELEPFADDAAFRDALAGAREGAHKGRLAELVWRDGGQLGPGML